MAITTTISINKNANAGIPSSYTPAALPTITPATANNYEVELPVATIEDASETVALTNLEADLQVWLDATYYDDILHLDAADTIDVNIRVTKIERVRQVANDFLPGLEFYKIKFTSQVAE